MGKKMVEGGVVKRNLVDGMDEDADVPAEGKFWAELFYRLTLLNYLNISQSKH